MNISLHVQELDNLNIYDILEPCFHSPEVREVLSEDSRLPSSFRKLGETDRPLPVRKRMFGRAWPLRAPVRDGRVPTWPELGSSSVPCTVCTRMILISVRTLFLILLRSK